MASTAFAYGLILGAIGCTGHIVGDEARDSRPGAAPQPIPPTTHFEDAPADPNAAGPLPLRLLTRVEYQNTVRELLGIELDVTRIFPPESSAETGFSKVQKVDQVSVAAYQSAAQSLAEVAGQNLARLMGCDVAAPANERPCLTSFVGDFGRKVYRRPLAADEVDSHVAFYDSELKAQLGLTAPKAVEALLAAMLQSPHFLYRWENGSRPANVEGGVVQLDAFHLASQLSYFLWASMPDGPLLDAAEASALSSSDQVSAQARRMLGDARAERTIAAFHEQWLALSSLPDLGKSVGLYPMWSRELGLNMAAELRRFASAVVLQGDGRLRTLLTSRQSFVNQPLAELYGIAGVSGPELVPRELPADQRAGLLTLSGFLSAHSGETEGSPILRGKYVRERLLCDTMPAPPDDIPPLPAPADDVSIKERHQQHALVSPCKDCHLLMDFIGFGFDNYDAIGRYRAADGGTPVDASGQVTGLDGASPTFNGPVELAELLGSSEQVRACVAKEWFRYAFARRELAPDRASFDQAFAAFRAADYDIRELLVGLATSRSFTHRSIDEGEVLP